MSALTAIVLTRNEAQNIKECLETLRFADHVLVFDSGSQDETPKIAARLGAEVIHHPFQDYPSQRNAAMDAAETEWVLFVDADERVPLRLASEVHGAMTQGDAFAGWRMPRHNYIFGKLIQAAGWFPDYQTRLLRKGAARYDPNRLVHEVVLLDGPLGTLDTPLIHHNYRDVAHFGEKQRAYSDYDAEILYQQGVRLKPWTLLSMPLRHFWWRYVTLDGYEAGLHGLHLSLLMARYEFRKYRRLGELWAANA